MPTMFSSELNEDDPETVEEFHLPSLEEKREGTLAKPLEFQLWDYGVPGGGLQNSPSVAVLSEEILAEARQKAQEIEQQAYEEGFQQGQTDGQEVGRRALEEVVKRLQNLVADLELERENLFHQREQVLLDLALLVSEKLVARELTQHPEAIREIIEEGFRQVAHLEGLRLLVSPPDFEILRQENLDSWPPGVEMAADGTINPGGFRLVTSLGEVDGTRETRWALMVQAVQQALETTDASSATD
jgi:flagellar assembly protein FliH